MGAAPCRAGGYCGQQSTGRKAGGARRRHAADERTPSCRDQHARALPYPMHRALAAAGRSPLMGRPSCGGTCAATPANSSHESRGLPAVCSSWQQSHSSCHTGSQKGPAAAWGERAAAGAELQWGAPRAEAVGAGLRLRRLRRWRSAGLAWCTRAEAVGAGLAWGAPRAEAAGMGLRVRLRLRPRAGAGAGLAWGAPRAETAGMGLRVRVRRRPRPTAVPACCARRAEAAGSGLRVPARVRRSAGPPCCEGFAYAGGTGLRVRLRLRWSVGPAWCVRLGVGLAWGAPRAEAVGAGLCAQLRLRPRAGAGAGLAWGAPRAEAAGMGLRVRARLRLRRAAVPPCCARRAEAPGTGLRVRVQLRRVAGLISARARAAPAVAPPHWRRPGAAATAHRGHGGGAAPASAGAETRAGFGPATRRAGAAPAAAGAAAAEAAVGAAPSCDGPARRRRHGCCAAPA